jgi:hypothetical protein
MVFVFQSDYSLPLFLKCSVKRENGLLLRTERGSFQARLHIPEKKEA